MRPTVVAIVALLALLPSLALAEGEAGLVVEWGDGTVSAFCIGFEGDSISGDQLLAEAGLVASDFTGLVCSINSVGCQHSGTFDSCTCQCPAGGDECAYWSFFTQRHGGTWIYSALGFRSQAARDGDLHGWRWGERTASSASAPVATSFEQVCGHAPGQAAVVPTSTPIPPTPAPAPATAAPSPPASTVPPMSTATPGATATQAEPTTSGATPAPTVTATPVESPPANGAATPSPTLAPLVTVPPPTPAPPAGGGSTGGYVAFGVVAAALLLGLGGALIWRRSHGA